MSISQVIVDFVSIAIETGGWMEMDRIYLQNRILGLIAEDELMPSLPSKEKQDSLALVDQLIEQAIINQVITNSESNIDCLTAQLMDFLTPPPSVINALFAKHYEKSPLEATTYFYELSKKNDYIKTRAIKKNIVFPVETKYGELEITINLSKPEKDPEQIATQRTATSLQYPKCRLCMENEGYKGRNNYPARTNHRIIRMNLNGESWGFQFSPYAYYNEHAIILSEKHQPMVISEATFRRLLQIVEIFPHYFVGSNADLPIVGGSILTHDHYQAGRHVFPMEKANINYHFEISKIPLVKAGIVKWPTSVIRLQSPDKDEIVKAATLILDKWRNYTDESCSIVAYSETGTPHHTITPIARQKNSLYEMDLVLRDNNISEQYPDGIFHPHKEVQHIKKENIGLIEVMGLAILPPRLKQELEEVRKYVLGKSNTIASSHIKWAEEIKTKYSFDEHNVLPIIQKEIGDKFTKVLSDAGVFKQTEKGQCAFKRFIDSLNE